MKTSEVVKKYADQFTDGDIGELVDQAIWSLSAERDEMFLRPTYHGAARMSHWSEVPTSPENFSDDEKWGLEPDEAEYWLSIAFPSPQQ